MTLTQVSNITRKTIFFSTIFILTSLSLWIGWKVGYAIYRKISPAPPPPPTVIFGKLSSLELGNMEKSNSYLYTLQTPTGELPQLPQNTTVFFMPKAQSSFANLEQATAIAQRLGFTGRTTALSEVIYRFEHRSQPSHLDINIINKTFSISYNLTQTPELLTLPATSTQEALNTTTSLLSRADLLTDDLSNGKVSFELLKTEGSEFTPVSSLSEANFIKVHLFRAAPETIEEDTPVPNQLPVMTPNPKKANVWFLISGAARDQKIIAGEYHYFPVDKTYSSTYPIKTAEVAWDELVQGQGFVANPPTNGSSNIIIRRVYLAYFDPGKFQQYLQPVIVFEGDADFFAYVPAITDEYYELE